MSLKLFYLPLRARTEATNMIFKYGSIEYEKVDISFSDWGKLKQEQEICNFGQLPSMELPSGKIISQSGAIARYAARLAGIYPSDPEIAAEADMIFELSQDMNAINPIMNFYDCEGGDWAKAHEKYFRSLPAWIQAAQRILGDKPFFGGESPHHGDFALFHICDATRTVKSDAFAEFPSISRWVDNMTSLPAVAKYFSERPGPATPGWGLDHSFLKRKCT